MRLAAHRRSNQLADELAVPDGGETAAEAPVGASAVGED